MATLLDDRQIVNRAALSALGNTANLTLDVIMNDINTFFANATSAATASVLMKRDVNANVQANNFIENLTSTATAAGTTTLTVASTFFQQFTGTNTQTVILPNATTLVDGQGFYVMNRSTGNVTVEANGGGVLQVMTANSQACFTVTSIGTSAGTWDISYTISGPVPFVQTQVTTDSTTTGSAATLLTGDILDGVVRLTNASLVSVSGIPAGASGQVITVENQTGNAVIINNNDAGASAANRIFTGSGGAAQMASNATFSFVYDTTVSRWMLIGGTGSGSGSGSGKNYLSVYTASTSSGVPNTGNGNAELGSTTGWSLGTIGTLTNGLPTGTPTFGSGASGNLSLGVVSSGQLAGSYSFSYASSAATTIGNMLASSAFFIDTEDQAKVLTYKMYYSVPVGSTTGNFSGTSSNSFGIAVWSVTDSAWLPVTSAFGMTQNAGVGYVTGTFQTGTATAQLRFVLYNINATSGAITLYLDDISVGPVTAPIGYAGNDWQSYTPSGNGTNWTTNCTYTGKWRRVGDSMEGQVTIAISGTPGSATIDPQVTLPGGYTIDSTKLQYATGSSAVLAFVGTGSTQYATGSSVYNLDTYVVSGTNNLINIGGLQNLSTFTGTVYPFDTGPRTSVPGAYAAGGSIVAWFRVPIAGWSSNVQMSSDTDTRVVAARYTSTAGTAVGTSPTLLPYATLSIDTHAAWNGTQYTAPVTGIYSVNAQFTSGEGSATVVSTIYIYKNGVAYADSSTNHAVALSYNISPSIATLVSLNAGDYIQIYASCDAGGYNNTTSANENFVSINRLSGPSVIAATESVNGRAVGSTTAIANNASTTIVFTTKTFDTHNVFNGTTLTVPVSGKYQINTGMNMSANWTAGGSFTLSIYHNGAAYTANFAEQNTSGSYAAAPIWLSDIVQCNAGDTITVVVSTASAGGTTAFIGNPVFSWSRVGN